MIAKQMYSEKRSAAVCQSQSVCDVRCHRLNDAKTSSQVFDFDDTRQATLRGFRRCEETHLLPAASTVLDGGICLVLDLACDIPVVGASGPWDWHDPAIFAGERALSFCILLNFCARSYMTGEFDRLVLSESGE